MREPQYSILVDIQDATERAKQGKLALYWQRTIQREYRCKKVTPAEQQAYEQLQSVLSEVPQWSDEEELHYDMEHTGGKLWFCHFLDRPQFYGAIGGRSQRQISYCLCSGHRHLPRGAPGGRTTGAKGTCGMYADMGCFATGCAGGGTDEVCFIGRSSITPYASPR